MPFVTKNLILINVVLFIAKLFLESRDIQLDFMLGSFVPYSPNFEFYQIITHIFMHGSWAHLIFNMIALFSFGTSMEVVLGAKKYLILYFVCGIGSYVLFNVWNGYQVHKITQLISDQGGSVSVVYENAKVNFYGLYHNPQRWMGLVGADKDDIQRLLGYLQTPMVGASGAIYGLLVGYSMLFPNSEIMMMFPPIPLKAKILMPILIAIELFLGMRDSAGDNIAHFAHLGGAVIAFVIIKAWTSSKRYRTE